MLCVFLILALNLCISIHKSPQRNHYSKLSMEIMGAKAERDQEVSKLSALKKQLQSLPPRIAYLENKAVELDKKREFLIHMRSYTKTQMNENERNTL